MYVLVTSRLFQEDSTRFDNKFQETTVKLPTETYSVSVIDLRYYYRYWYQSVLLRSIGLRFRTLVTTQPARARTKRLKHSRQKKARGEAPGF